MTRESFLVYLLFGKYQMTKQRPRKETYDRPVGENVYFISDFSSSVGIRCFTCEESRCSHFWNYSFKFHAISECKPQLIYVDMMRIPQRAHRYLSYAHMLKRCPSVPPTSTCDPETELRWRRTATIKIK